MHAYSSTRRLLHQAVIQAGIRSTPGPDLFRCFRPGRGPADNGCSSARHRRAVRRDGSSLVTRQADQRVLSCTYTYVRAVSR